MAAGERGGRAFEDAEEERMRRTVRAKGHRAKGVWANEGEERNVEEERED